jgi:hypothetical protein
MTICLPLPTPASYTVQAPIRELAPAESIFRAMSDEGMREEVLLKKLGPKGWGRIHHFLSYYEGGWGGGNPPLSPKVLSAFHRFLELVIFPNVGTCPSVFLTDRGGLELCWEDVGGKSIQVEFFQDGIEYFRASLDEEAVVGFDQIKQIARELSVE